MEIPFQMISYFLKFSLHNVFPVVINTTSKVFVKTCLFYTEFKPLTLQIQCSNRAKICFLSTVFQCKFNRKAFYIPFLK